MTTEVLQLTHGCWLEKYTYKSTDMSDSVSICYTEHSPDNYYSDRDTDVELTRQQAIDIIKALMDVYCIAYEEIQ
jgi:hypothetical protein